MFVKSSKSPGRRWLVMIGVAAGCLLSMCAVTCRASEDLTPAPGAVDAALATLPDGRYLPGSIKLLTRVVGSVPASRRLLAFSPDGQKAAIPQDLDGRQVVVSSDEFVRAGGQAAGAPAGSDKATFKALGFDATPLFSPDGSRLAWIAYLGPERYAAVVDGKVGPEYQGIGNLTFSPDSKRFAYSATLPSSKQCIVIDGREHETGWSTVINHGIAFSPDSAHVGYAGVAGVIADFNVPSYHVIVDGVPWKPTLFRIDSNDEPVPSAHGSVADPAICFSTDGKHAAVVAERVALDDVPRTTRPSGPFTPSVGSAVVLDGVPQKTYLRILPHTLQFTRAGHLMYCASTKPGEVALVDDGVEAFHYAEIHKAVFSPDGRRMAFIANKPAEPTNIVAHSVANGRHPLGKPVLVIDGVETQATASQVIFSPDSRRLAYVESLETRLPNGTIEHNGHVAVVVDGQRGKTYYQVTHLQFSPDGKHVAYVAGSRYGDPSAATVVVDEIELALSVTGEIYSLAFAGAGTFNATMLGSDGSWRVLELKLAAAAATAVPPASPSSQPVVTGSAASEAVVARLRGIADLAAAPQRDAILWEVPLVYARSGEKEAALAALRQAESRPSQIADVQPALRSNFAPGVNGATLEGLSPDLFAAPQDEAHKLLRRLELLVSLIAGQMKAGDKAGAAQTADELYAAVMKIENVQLPENARYLELASAGCARAGRLDQLAKLAAAARRNKPHDKSALLASAVELESEAGNYAAAEQMIALIPDAGARVISLYKLASAREEAGDAPRALEFFKAAMKQLQQVPTGSVKDLGINPKMLLRGLIHNGDATAAADWVSGLPPAGKRSAATVLAQVALEQSNARDFVGTANTYAVTAGLNVGPGQNRELFQAMLATANGALSAGDAGSASSIVSSAWTMFAGVADPSFAFEICIGIGPIQRKLGDGAGLTRTVEKAVEAFGKLYPADLPAGPEARLELLVRISALHSLAAVEFDGGDRAAAAATCRKAADTWAKNRPALDSYPYTSIPPIVGIAVLGAKAGDATGAADTFRLIRGLIDEAKPLPASPDAFEASKACALCILADGQARAGDLNAAQQTLGQVPLGLNMGNSGGKTPEWAWSQIAGMQWAQGDAAAAYRSLDKAIQCAGADATVGYRPGGWSQVAADVARNGDPAGAAAMLSRANGVPISPEAILAVAQAMAEAGDLANAQRTLLRLGDANSFVYCGNTTAVAQALLRKGDYKGAATLLSSATPQGQPMDTSQALQAAADAGDVDFVVKYLTPPASRSAEMLAANRLDASDPAGAVRILKQGLEATLAGPDEEYKPALLAELAEGLLAAGDKADALAAVRLLRSPPDPGIPATQPATAPASRPATAVGMRSAPSYFKGYGRMSPAVAAGLTLTRVQILAGDFDGALAWVGTQEDPLTRAAAVATAADVVLKACDPAWGPRSLLADLGKPGQPDMPKRAVKKKQPG